MSSAHAIPAWLPASPDAAVALATLGFGLVFLEFNRPGSVLPGALGAALVLLSIPPLLPGPHPLWALFLLLLAAVLLALPLRYPVPVWISVLASLALLIGLHGLLPHSGVHWPFALLCSAALFAMATPLAHAARRSRNAKRAVHQSR